MGICIINADPFKIKADPNKMKTDPYKMNAPVHLQSMWDHRNDG